MNGRTIVRVLAALVLVVVAIGIGTAVYNAGVSAGLTDAAQQAIASGNPAPAAPYGYGNGPYWHGFGFGWGFFGIFFWIIGIFLVFGLLRAAFGWGRPRGPRGWYGPDGRADRDSRVAEWHRELHRREGDQPQGSSGA